MNLFQSFADGIKARTTLACLASRAKVDFRPKVWEVKSLGDIKFGTQPLRYVGVVIAGNDASDLIKVSGFSFAGATISARNAFFEYLEVAMCRRHGVTSAMTRSGCAIGRGIDDAKKRAWFELVERDAFLSHYLCADLKSEPIRPPKEVRASAISVVRLQTVDEKVAVVLAMKRRGQWACLGMGADESVEFAAIKACSECEMLLSEWSLPTDLSDATPRLKNFLPHWQAANSDETLTRLTHLFRGGGSETLRARLSIEDARTEFCEVFPCGSDPRVAFAAGVRLTHEQVIPFSIGPIWESSHDRVLAALSSRNLNGTWAVHPFL